MRKFFIAACFSLTLSAFAAAPPRGNSQLRELVVFPEMNLNFNFGMHFEGNGWVMDENVNLPDEIAETNLICAKAIFEKTPDSDEKNKRWREFMLNGAIFWALNNQPETAKDWANKVLKYFPNDDTAKEISKMVD